MLITNYWKFTARFAEKKEAIDFFKAGEQTRKHLMESDYHPP